MRLHAVVCPVYLLLLACILSPAAALTRPSGTQAVAVGRYERMRRVIIEVAADPALSGERVTARDGGKALGSATLRLTGADATATLELPMPAIGEAYGPISIARGRRTLVTVTLPDARDLRHFYLPQKRLRFAQYVFAGEQFPGCEFDNPADVENLIGRYAIKVKYIDAAGSEVATAKTPGRYGAIVEVTGEDGWVQRRFATLYRSPQNVNWWGADLRAQIALPVELGISPEVAAKQTGAIGGFIKDKVVDGIFADDQGAALLAGLSEQTADKALDIGQRNEDWWFAQRKRRGLMEHHYYTRMPRGYDDNSGKRYPLLVYLHGSGNFIDRDLNGTLGLWQFLKEHPNYECMFVAPQGELGGWWSPAYVNDLVEEAMAKYRVDEDRVYLTGASMGGFGTWSTAIAFPERFAAVAPICGGGDPRNVARMKDVPTWAFHGAKDPIVPISMDQPMVDALKAAGGDVRFTIYPEGDHDAYTATFKNPEFYQWLFAQKRGERQIEEGVARAMEMDASDRRVLEGVPKIGYHKHLCPFPGSLFSVLQYLKDRVDYDYLMGVTGAPFRRTFERDDGGNVDLMYFAPEPYERAFRALGYEYRVIPAKDKSGMFTALKQSIDAGKPVIAFGIIGPPEAGLITGYDKDGETVFGYSYFQDPSLPGYYEQADWYAKAQWPSHAGLGFIVIGDRAAKPSDRETFIASLEWAIKLERMPKLGADHVAGLAAYEAWAKAMEVDADYPKDDAKVLATRVMVHGDQTVMLGERRCAARYLRAMAKVTPQATAELEAAAALYDKVADEENGVWRWGENMGPEVGQALTDPALRRDIAAHIRAAAAVEAEAVTHLEKALAVLKGAMSEPKV